MKAIKILTIAGVVLFLVGCAGQGVNLNRQHIVFVEGKPFRIPNGASHRKQTYANTTTDKIKLSTYRKNGLDCRQGDILWFDSKGVEKSKSIILSGDKIGGYAYLARKSQEGKAGCVRPLSNREYDYYRQNDAAQASRDYATRRQIANNIANSTPKTYNVNVNHSGYINQNVNHSGYINTYNYRY